MASRRMFNIGIVSNDKFRTLPAGTQLLYFHLCLSADDEGFVENAISLIQILPVSFEDLKNLIDRGYVIFLEDYLYVIKDWKVHNRITNQKFTGTRHVTYLNKLRVTDNESYSLTLGKTLYDFEKEKGCLDKIIKSNNLEIEGIQEVNNSYTQNIQTVSQLSEVKSILGQSSEVKVISNDEIRSFLNSHNLTSLDSRYEIRITEFFKVNNKDESDLIQYLDYVFKYSMAYHPDATGGVEPKLFYANSLQQDVLNRFYINKSNKKSNNQTIQWPDICPICNQFHDSNGKHEICTLDLSKPNSVEDLEEAKKGLDKYQESISKMIHNLSANFKKNQSLGAS